MVTAGNKANCISPVNHSAKTIHHHSLMENHLLSNSTWFSQFEVLSANKNNFNCTNSGISQIPYQQYRVYS